VKLGLIPLRISILLIVITLCSIRSVAHCAQIHDAIITLDVDKVKSLIVSEPSLVNAKDSNGLTPLHWAVSGKHGRESGDGALQSKRQRKIVELLLAKGADVNAITPDGSTPLYIAALEEDDDMVKLLIDHGAKMDIVVVAMLDMGDRVKELLHANPDVVNVTEHGDMTALHWAAARGHLKTVQILLAAGADPDSSSASGETPLASAACIGSHEVVQLLLDHGARVDTREDQSGLTALHRAAESGDKETIKLLLAKGADVNVKESRNGKQCTPLHLAAEEGRKDAVEALLSAGANINAKDSDGRAPLWYALHGSYGDRTTSTNRQKIAEILRENGGRE
jgi:ankyrin repeat protein